MYEVTNNCLCWVSNIGCYLCAPLFQLGEPHKCLLHSARIFNVREKYSSSYKTLLLASWFLLRHGREGYDFQSSCTCSSRHISKANWQSMTQEDRQTIGAVEAVRCWNHLYDKAASNGQNQRAGNPAGAVLQQGCRFPPSCHRPPGRASNQT